MCRGDRVKTIFHVDMNSFFASCEQTLRPELKGKPIIVGGDPEKRRGIVLAASYEAKAFGVKTAMPIYQAMKLCPQAEVLRSTYGLYSTLSKQVMEIFDRYTPLKEQVSIDEAYLDLTGTEKIHGDDLFAIAKRIQKDVLDEVDLGCSIGISSNKLLAKMASDFKKPMGITKIYPSDVEAMLWDLPVGELHGVGKKSVEKLKDLKILTIRDLATYDVLELERIFGHNMGRAMHNKAHGMGNDVVHSNEGEEMKSVSNELTFSNDIKDLDQLNKKLLIISESVGYRVRKKGVQGKTIQLKVKFSNFQVITRSITLNHCTDVTETIYLESKKLLDQCWNKKPIRLLGVGLTNFQCEEMQTNLLTFLENDKVSQGEVKQKKADELADQLREKFGYNAVKRAATINERESIRKR